MYHISPKNLEILIKQVNIAVKTNGIFEKSMETKEFFQNSRPKYVAQNSEHYVLVQVNRKIANTAQVVLKTNWPFVTYYLVILRVLGFGTKSSNLRTHY